jgi:hypothetical protein
MNYNGSGYCAVLKSTAQSAVILGTAGIQPFKKIAKQETYMVRATHGYSQPVFFFGKRTATLWFFCLFVLTP